MISLLLLFSVIIGLIFAYLIKIHYLKINTLLNFSSAYLFGTVFNHLLPEVYSKENQSGIGFFVLGGILIQVLLETITNGIEHGHMHSKNVSFTPYGVFLGLFTHSFLESMVINNDHYDLLYAIVIHKIPIATILYFFLTNVLKDKKKVMFWMGIFALSPLLGVWIGEFKLFTQYKIYVNAFVAGIFIHIATIIWFESSDGHRINLSKVLIFLLGIILSYIF